VGAVAALVVTTGAYLAVRDTGESDTALRADDQPSTSTSRDRATTTTAEDPSTSTTTLPPTSATTASTSSGGATPGPSTTATSRAPTTTAAPATTAPAPPFQSSIETVTLEQLGSSWRAGMGCPGPDQLRAVNVSHWGYDGAVHIGRLIVDAGHAQRMVAVFRDIYAARFPIQRMVPIDQYGGDDQASMRANNTSGFNCRYVSGTTTLSQHGLGRAVDVNPLVNPYVKGSTVDPPEGAPYADRSRNDPGMIHAGDAVVRAFAAQGWKWGGYWSSGKDYQHFSASGG
jgi:D-alanyl-D-alanine carboxypeptidase